MQARSLGSARRPVFGRPVAAVVVVAALIATFAVGAPAALAGEPPGPGDTAADASQTTATPPAVETPPPADPPAVETPPADPPAGDPPAGDPPSGDPPAADPPPAGTPGGQSPPTGAPEAETPPAGTPNADSPGGQSPPAGTPNADPPPQSPSEQQPAQPAPPAGGNHSAAHNQSRVIQAVWQVQQGCRTYCHGTSQTQRSEQVSNTTQRATAISGESPNGGGSSAQARNESSTIQFVWQMQIGCVAFCFHASQSQEASQQSYTTQEADAQSALTALAENLAETVQFVFQFQRGCEHECHGVTQHQSSTQGQTTSQSATAEALAGGIGLFLLPDWLTAYAQNIGATIQLIYQYQEALCLEHCMGDAQLQEAIQRALTDQNAVALAAPPEPAQPPPGEEPPGEQPPPGPTGPGVASETRPPAVAASASSGSVRHGFVLGRSRRRTVRRQELVLRAGAPSPGGGRAMPDGPAPVAPAAGGPASGGVRLAAAAGSTTGTVKAIQTTDDRRDVRAGGGNLPSETFAVPSGPNAGGSMGWLLILLLTVAVAALIASLRRLLATTMTRI